MFWINGDIEVYMRYHEILTASKVSQFFALGTYIRFEGGVNPEENNGPD